jgi:hypothetical protein
MLIRSSPLCCISYVASQQVIMGEGFSAIPRLYGQKLSSKLEEAMEQDESRTNICALFFVKKGFPFVSVLNGGFCAAHAWLVREGSSRHLNASSVLIDYEPDNSLFGQMERLHNASSTEKAKRNMQYMLEKSLVAVTLKAQQLEKNLDQNQGIGNLRLGQIFGGGGHAAAKADNSTSADTQTVPAVDSGNGDESASNNLKGFKNPFARGGTGWTSSAAHDEGSSDTAPKEEGSSSNTMVPQFLTAFARKQAAGTTSDDAVSGDAHATPTTTGGEVSTEETTLKSQPISEKGSTTAATPAAAAASGTPAVTAPPNPFAMFRQGKVNDESAAAAANPAEKKPPAVAAATTGGAGQTNNKPSFRGLGSWKAQAAAASSAASSFRFGVVANKKTTNTEMDGGGAGGGVGSSNSFAGLNNLRKSTLARMRSATDKAAMAHNEESIAFD